MANRPKRGDTEDDLLDFQEQFLASRNIPSAAVVRVNKDPRDKQEQHLPVQRDVVDLKGLPQSLANPIGDIGPPKKKSKFKEKRLLKMKVKVGSDFTDDRDEDMADLLDRHDTHVSTVLSEIRERDIQKSQVVIPNKVLSKGFPEALHRGQIAENQQESSTSNHGKRSLFAQHFKAANPSIFGLPQMNQQNDSPSEKQIPTNGVVMMQKSQGGSFSSSRLVSGKGLISSSAGSQQSVASREVESIHKENVERLCALSKEEILQEQERLMKSLDPNLLSFLRLRHQQKTSEAMKASQREAKMEIEEHSTSTHLTGLENKIETDSSIRDVSPQKCETMDVETEDKHVHFDNNVDVTKQHDMLKDKVVEVDKLTKMATEQKWVHMDTVEEEKLEWMKDCPAPSAVKKESDHQARFAFDGSLITRNADIPVNVGLHHHGDEPDAAGYTLEELFVLSRSSFLQQRVVALQTLARIIVQDTQGAFTDLLQCSVLSTLLDAGIIFLLRWAMDDTADAVIAVAIQCLAAVLVVPNDQDCCDRVCEWHRGQELPSLRPEVEEKNENESEDEDRRSETDAEVVKKDVIKGLLQMRILPRLRYILEVCRPSPTTVRGVFSILTRIAKHSTGASHEIVKCPRLLESVFSKFLPTSWRKVHVPLNDVTDMYGLPSHEALTLLRAICSSGRHLSSLLISKHNLINYILCYTSFHPQNIQLSFEDGMKLCIESIRTWTICISYGLACDQFREIFPTFLQHIQKLQDISVIKHSTSVTGLESECRRACSLLNLLEHVIHVAGTSAEMHAKMLASSPNANIEAEADCLPPPPVNWSHVMGFIPLVAFALNKWKNEIVSLEEKHLDSLLDCHVLRCTSMCNLLASFYSKLPSQPSFSPVDSLQDIEDLVSTILLPVINSAFLGCMIKRLRNVSTSPKAVLFTRGTPNLPDYGTLPANAGYGTTEPTQPFSHGPAVAFITSLTRLSCSVINVHKGIAAKFLPLVTGEEVIDYIQSISSTQEILSQSYFGRFELHMQYFLIKVFYLVVRSVDCKDMSTSLAVYHSSALVVFSRLRAGDEHYAHDLLSTILFNPDFYPEAKDQETTSVARDLSVLNITAKGVPSQPLLTKDNRSYTQKELLCEAHKSLLGIRSTYMSSFGKVRHALAASRSLALHQPHDIQSLLLSPSRGPFLPADWMFVPIVDLHNQTLSAESKGGVVDEVPPAMISTVTCTLQMILMLEEWRPVSLSSVSMVAKITRLMCIFLTGSDLFLDRLVHHYVRSLLLVYTRPSYLSRLDFRGNVSGLSSFYDLYTSLLTHYSAVSFGDPLFASFLVLPLAQRHDVKFRRALWDEFVGTIRAVSFHVKQVPLPLDHFLYPIEQDDVLLYLYLRALANQDARPRWCPFFYLLAVHHVNAFIYQRIDPKDTLLLKRKLSLLSHVMQVKLQDVRTDILYYYKPLPDSSSDKSFEVFSSLPPDREILLRNRQDIEECRKLYEKMAK